MAKQSGKKYQNLLDKAEELFWKYGYTSVSVDQIAKEAGISKMTIYKHFHSKEDLFVAVLMNNTEFHLNKLIEKIDEKYHTLDKIEAMYHYMLEINSQLSPVFVKEVMDRVNVLTKIVAYKEKRTLEIWRNIVEDGIQKKEIRNLDIDFISNLLLYMPTIFMKTDSYIDEAKRLKMFDNFFDFMRYGLLGGIESPKESTVKEGI
ncbi:MAG: transcriptional regulator TetR family [Clostridia bacterium]|jgi:AcrR family transcriptional regulator|nr:transcriptional regulator TetR family [Clostridia bacterium]